MIKMAQERVPVRLVVRGALGRVRLRLKSGE
jgi:hypothetical protein